jgi:hypothetical protein
LVSGTSEGNGTGISCITGGNIRENAIDGEDDRKGGKPFF